MLEKISNILMALILLVAIVTLIRGKLAYDQGYASGHAAATEEQQEAHHKLHYLDPSPKESDADGTRIRT